MGSVESRTSHTHHRTRYPPSSSHYDWDKEEGGYIPHRFQAQQRRRWHQEDKAAHAQKVRDATERERNRLALVNNYDANGEKAKLKARYKEHMGRKRAEAHGRQVRDAAERERNGEALRSFDVHEKKGALRRGKDEERRRKKGKGETIRVYASPDLKSRWSDSS